VCHVGGKECALDLLVKICMLVLPSLIPVMTAMKVETPSEVDQ
jgi:hypothetical protein